MLTYFHMFSFYLNVFQQHVHFYKNHSLFQDTNHISLSSTQKQFRPTQDLISTDTYTPFTLSMVFRIRLTRSYGVDISMVLKKMLPGSRHLLQLRNANQQTSTQAPRWRRAAIYTFHQLGVLAEQLELAIASWAFCHFLEAKLKWKTQGFYCNFPPHIYIIMGFVLVCSPHSHTEYLLIISLRSAANMA